MRLLWSKSSNPVDWLIGLITGQDCAHFAFSFYVNGQELVFESNLLGCRTVFYSTWMKSKGRTIIHQRTVDITIDEINSLWQTWVTYYDGHSYDFLGAIYTGIMILRERIFGIPKPKMNAWGSKTSFYCDEIYELVSGKPGFPRISEKSNGMDSPHDVWEKVN